LSRTEILKGSRNFYGNMPAAEQYKSASDLEHKILIVKVLGNKCFFSNILKLIKKGNIKGSVVVFFNYFTGTVWLR